jgi:hypothetical protein
MTHWQWSVPQSRVLKSMFARHLVNIRADHVESQSLLAKARDVHHPSNLH